MPSTLQCTNGNRADYLYGADGVKRRVTHKTAIANISVPMGQIKELTSGQVSQTHTTDYCGNVIYENGNLSKILTEEGFVTVSGTTLTYHYYLKDHQGNNRVVLHQNGTTVEQVNHYYPFGGLFGEGTATSNQAYKYNGKELDRMHGLDWYDYGVRMYDAALGRFHTNDRFAEKYYSMSTYQYGANNPVKNIDVDGDSVRVYTETTSNYGLGHTWISTGEGENMVVYSYGRYDGTNKGEEGSLNSIANGPGVLLRLTGEAAQMYNDKKALTTNMLTFTVQDISDAKLLEVLDDKFNSSTQLPNNPNSEYYDNSLAHVVDEYDILNNNCATTVSQALNSAGSNVLKGYMQQTSKNIGMWQSIPILKVYNTPVGIQNHMRGIYKSK